MHITQRPLDDEWESAVAQRSNSMYLISPQPRFHHRYAPRLDLLISFERREAECPHLHSMTPPEAYGGKRARHDSMSLFARFLTGKQLPESDRILRVVESNISFRDSVVMRPRPRRSRTGQERVNDFIRLHPLLWPVT